MTMVWFTSDWHLGHRNINKLRQFESHEENCWCMFDLYSQTIGKKDLVWFVGDIAMNRDWLMEMKKLPGRKKIVLGNHDTDRFARGISYADLLEVFESMHGMVKYKGAWVTHAPLHPQELMGRINIHGHLHGSKVLNDHEIPDTRYVNVSVEQTAYMPVTFPGIQRLQSEYMNCKRDDIDLRCDPYRMGPVYKDQYKPT